MTCPESLNQTLPSRSLCYPEFSRKNTSYQNISSECSTAVQRHQHFVFHPPGPGTVTAGLEGRSQLYLEMPRDSNFYSLQEYVHLSQTSLASLLSLFTLGGDKNCCSQYSQPLKAFYSLQYSQLLRRQLLVSLDTVIIANVTDTVGLMAF